MLAFRMCWPMSRADSGTSSVTRTDTWLQAHAPHYHYICVIDPFLACKALASGN